MNDKLVARLRKQADELESLIPPLGDSQFVLDISGLAVVKRMAAMVAHTAGKVLDLREAADRLGRTCDGCKWQREKDGACIRVLSPDDLMCSSCATLGNGCNAWEGM